MNTLQLEVSPVSYRHNDLYIEKTLIRLAIEQSLKPQPGGMIGLEQAAVIVKAYCDAKLEHSTARMDQVDWRCTFVDEVRSLLKERRVRSLTEGERFPKSGPYLLLQRPIRLFELGNVVVDGTGLCSVQELSCPRKFFCSMAVGEKTVVANADETFGKHMEQKPSQKLHGVQAHRALAITVGVVFPTKGDLSVFHRHEPVVGDRDAVGIAGEVFEHLLGTAEWRLGIDHPVFVSKWLEPSFPALGIL